MLPKVSLCDCAKVTAAVVVAAAVIVIVRAIAAVAQCANVNVRVAKIGM